MDEDLRETIQQLLSEYMDEQPSKGRRMLIRDTMDRLAKLSNRLPPNMPNGKVTLRITVSDIGEVIKEYAVQWDNPAEAPSLFHKGWSQDDQMIEVTTRIEDWTKSTPSLEL